MAENIFVLSLVSWFKGQDGATAIEYALIAGGISLAISGAVYLFGDQLLTMFYDDLPAALSQ